VSRSARSAALLGARSAVLCAVLLSAGSAAAHQRSLSYSTWMPDATGARVHARVSQLDLSRLGLAFLPDTGADDPVARTLAEHLVMRAGDQPCVPRMAPSPREAPEGWVIYSWSVECPPGERSIETSLFLDVAPSHLHFARVTRPDGSAVERVLSEAQPRWFLSEDAPAARSRSGGEGTSFGGYVALGVEHILSGWDHLAFVIALLMLAGTLRQVAALVTAFTVAHSVTLGLATLGVVRPEAAPVEALIGFSIALVAAENSWILAGRDRVVPWVVALGLAALALVPGAVVSPLACLGLALFSLCHFGLLRRSPRPARLRAAVAFAFGLVHGFGFAGVLAELELPTSRLVPALFGFNVGVELGQLGVVFGVWPLLWALARAGGERAALRAAEWASAGVCGLGLYWFVVRSLG
jgi:hypothetical protein